MLFQVIADALHVRGGGRRPTDTHLGAEHLFKAGIHLFFLDEFPAIGVGFAFYTAARKRASSSSSRKAVTLSSSPASALPSRRASCAN
jgi:hypothetical protein